MMRLTALGRRVDGADVTPIGAWDLVDQHVGVGLRVGRPLLDGVDDVVDASDDLAPLIRRQRAFRDINLGYRNAGLLR